MKLLTKFVIFPLFFLCYLLPASAEGDSDPKAFIEKMGKVAINILANPNKSLAEREAAFRGILNNFFDVRAIAKFVIGGRQWKALQEQGPQAVEEYVNLFKSEIARSYAIRFENYHGEQFKVMGAVEQSDKKSWVVSSKIERPEGGEMANVDWVVRQTSGSDLRVFDVKVERISMSFTKRAEYKNIIEKNGLEGFIALLKQQHSIKPKL